jgi:hypothetical protein
VNIPSNNQIPYWAETLIEIGEQFVLGLSRAPSRPQTLALCLPCINYAAAFLGIGLLKAGSTHKLEESHQKRLESLLGCWVSYTKMKLTSIGILEFCEVTAKFKIRTQKHGLWDMLNTEDWILVRPIGREFNPNRRLNKQQITKILSQNQSLHEFSEVFGFDLWKPALEKSGCIFSMFGNKTRLHQELTQPLFPGYNSSLVDILRPEGHLDYGQSFHCTVVANRSTMPDTIGALVIIEAGRALPDQIAQSKHLNRILLLPRNSADYEQCAGLVMEEFSLRQEDSPQIQGKLPESLRSLQYYHR